jgi:putative transposase
MLRHKWLDLHIFETIEEVRQIANEWLSTCKKERPNM